MRQWLFNILLGLDQLANAALGGDPDMTLSGRMGRAIQQGRCKLCRPVCWILHKLDKNHCAKADRAEADEGRAELWRW